jgi:hypothetical protein
MNLSAEQIQKNWERHLKIVEMFIQGDRKDKLVALYESLAEEMITAPASGKQHYHNCFPGGYVEHVNRVVQCALKVKSLWHEMGADVNFTDEELVFSALNHDLGKLGLPGKPGYLPQTDQWRKDKLGEMYSNNTDLSFMLIQDRSLFTLQHAGIPLSENEYMAIKLHDGLYDDVNKPYYITFNPDSKLRSNIVHILHQADFMASKVEYDRWKKTQPAPTQKPVKGKTATGKTTVSSPGLAAVLKNI